MIEYIQSVLLIISAILIIIAAIGLISLGKDTKNKVYARIHIVGVFDIACILVMIAIGQYLLAGIYFILAPFTAHAIANAYWKKEDRENNADLNNLTEEVDEDNPFIHPVEKIRDEENNNSQNFEMDDTFSFTTIEIDEGE